MSVRGQLERFDISLAPPLALRWPSDLPHAHGAGIRIALLDSGLDFSNPAFKHAHLRGHDFTGSGTLADRSGHGTANAALLVGQTEQAMGLTPESELLVAKVIVQNDRARTLLAIVKALQWAMREQVHIIVLPFGSSQGAARISQLIHTIVRSGIEVFAAAGNRGSEQISYPAWLPEVKAVSALTTTGNVLKGCCSTSQVDIYCWGDNVPSIARGRFYQLSGSSPATVLAAGVRALQLSQGQLDASSHL